MSTDRAAEVQRLRDAIHRMADRMADSRVQAMQRQSIEQADHHDTAAERRHVALVRLTARLASIATPSPAQVLDFRPGRRGRPQSGHWR